MAYYWHQRENDIVKRAMWSDYQPSDRVRVRHHKNRNRKKGERENLVWLLLRDPETGASLYPEIVAQIALTPVRGPLMVMRDHPDKRRKAANAFKPYAPRFFKGLAREILDAAGLPRAITFASFRHGGFTESGNASGTDQELMASGGHKTRDTLSVYVKRSNPQAINLAKKRLALREAQRTKKGNLSE